jgi:hypothetical protein
MSAPKSYPPYRLTGPEVHPWIVDNHGNDVVLSLNLSTHYAGVLSNELLMAAMRDALNKASLPDEQKPFWTGYSREGLTQKMEEWMGPLEGITDPAERERWLRDNGLLHQFIRAHFPADPSPES